MRPVDLPGASPKPRRKRSMYVYSKTPDPPKNKNTCSVRVDGEHEPADIVGSSFERMFPSVRTDDGGIVQLMPCKHCGLVYWDAVKKEDVLQ